MKERTPLECQFFANRTPLQPYGGIGLIWWCAPSAGLHIKDICSMAMLYDTNLRFGDLEGFSAAIVNALKENALNPSLFDASKVCGHEVDTLFSARKIEDVREFSKRLWEVIHKAMIQELKEWLIAYPLYRMSVPSSEIGFDGLSILEPANRDAWDRMGLKYSGVRSWSPQTGMVTGSTDRLFRGMPESWLVCEIKGTKTGALQIAGERMKTFISVLLSFEYSSNPRVLRRSADYPVSYCMQFSEELVYTSIGIVLHPLLSKIAVSDGVIRQVVEWYKSRDGAGGEKARRASVASQFIHNSIMATGGQKFIQLFIALDALFGIRGQVESKIKEGVTKVFADDKGWTERAEELFDLRSELVHGGCSRIEEWKRLEHYRGYFKEEPLRDVTICAMACIREFFKS